MTMQDTPLNRDREMIPVALLRGMLALALGTLAVVSFATITDRAHVGTPAAASIVSERTIILKGGGAQAVTVLNKDGTVLMDLPHGGFITVVQNAMERERKVAGVDPLLPLRIVKFENGRLAAIDDTTGWSVELYAFGGDNKAAFERLMSN